MPDRLIDEVSALLREVAQAAILPRFRRLQASEIEEKAPGEAVTRADREAESLLSARLVALLPGSRVIGEEAASRRPALLGSLGEGLVWLVDPLDGTANFIAGKTDFSVMVALLRNGAALASWMLDPPRDVMHIAVQGAGAFVGGARLRCDTAVPATALLQGAVLTGFLPPPLRDGIEARAGRIARILPGLRCAGSEYPAVATGRQHFALFWRTLPWDHVPGTLFLTEAGGWAAHPDGRPYRPLPARPGLLAAQNRAVWDATRAALLA